LLALHLWFAPDIHLQTRKQRLEPDMPAP
jgi:hypothetical protein